MDDVYVLNPDLGMRPDVGRAILFNRDPLRFRKGMISTERSVVLALLDGRRSLADLDRTIAYLFDLETEESARTVGRFVDAGVAQISKDMGLKTLVRRDELPPGTSLRSYDPAVFARAGAGFPTGRKLRSPITCSLLLSFDCPVDCIYCYANRRPVGPGDLLSDARIRELIKEIIDLEIPVVSFSGGDPFSHPHLLDYIEMLIGAGIGVELPTKTPLHERQVARLAAIGLDEIQISIDGPNAEICDAMVRRPGWFDRICGTMRMLRQAGIGVRTNTILTSYNIRFARETVLMLHGLGSRQIKLTNYSRSAYHHSDAFWVGREDAARLLSQVEELRPLCQGSTLIYEVEQDFAEKTSTEKEAAWPPPPSCTAFVDSMVICPDGSCLPCEEMLQCHQYVLGNVRRKSLQEVWDSPRFDELQHPPREFFKGTVCFDCTDYERCHYEWGYCFRDAYKAYGSVYAPTPACPRAPIGRKLMGPA
jgi:radical SAM protein with 4Fe4S-binding SPASM domain